MTRVEAAVERYFPGLPWRAAWMTAIATWLLVVYHHQGSPWNAPDWFVAWSREVTGIRSPTFHGHLWGHLTAALLLLLVPLLLCRITQGWSARDLGLGVRGAKREMLLVLGLWLVFVPIIWFFSRTQSFLDTYPRLPEAEGNARLFLIYEAIYPIKWIAWEFFFRGFMLFGLRKDLGSVSVLVSTVAFTLMHVGKPEAEMASAVIGGFVLCAIALKSRSIWPGVVIHYLVALTMDFLASSWWR